MTHTTSRRLRTAAVAAAAGAVGFGMTATSPASAAVEGADYYNGKTVTYIVATAAGGGYDFYGRLISKYMEKYLPGSTFVVKNVPGAGHIIGANLIYASKPDGQTIGTFNTGLILSQLIGRPGIKFDLAKMTWIGKAASDPRVIMVAAQSDIKSVQQLKTHKPPVKFATSGVGSSAYNDTMMLGTVLGWNMKMILGYNGNESELAMRRGEIDASVGSLSSAELFVKNGYGRIIAQIGGKPEAGAPMLKDVVDGRKEKAIVALVGSQADLARFTAGPPGIPANRTATLRAAYKMALEDPELQKQAAKADRPIDPAYGEDVAKAVKAALDQPPEVIAMVSKILNIKPPTSEVTTKLLKVSADGKHITFEDGGEHVKSKVSGSRTKIKINGEKAKRKALKAGMTCKISYKPGGDNEPVTLDCQS